MISHLHGDHINGLARRDNKLAFPNAEIMVPAVDWAFWMSDENAARRKSNAMMKGNFANVRKVFGGIDRQGDAVRMGQGGGARHHRDRDPRPHAGPHLVRGRLGQSSQGAGPVRRHQHPGVVPAQSGLARRCSTPTGHRRRRPAASSTTWRRPRRCWCRASTSRSRRSGYVEKDGTGYRLVPVAVESDDLNRRACLARRRPPILGGLFASMEE